MQTEEFPTVLLLLYILNAPHIKLYKPLTYFLIYSLKHALACCWSLTPARLGSTHAVSQTQPKSTRAVCSAGQNVSAIKKSPRQNPPRCCPAPLNQCQITLLLLPHSSSFHSVLIRSQASRVRPSAC